MGKKNRKNRKRRVRPSRVDRVGPIQIAQYGDLTVMENLMSEEQVKHVHQEMAKEYPEVCNEIDALIARIIVELSRFDPKAVLCLSYHNMYASFLGIETESSIDFDKSIALRMVDYIQALYVSVPMENSSVQPSDEGWKTIKQLVSELFTIINGKFFICYSSYREQNEDDFDWQHESWYVKSMIYWCNVRGKRFSEHDLRFYEKLLSPHELVFRELYSVGVEGMLDGLTRISKSLASGSGAAWLELKKLHTEFFSPENETKLLEGLESGKDIHQLTQEFVQENYGDGWLEKNADFIMGDATFDLQKVTKLPTKFLEEFSWGVGEEVEFYQKEGEFRGWPMRVWPSIWRPFIKLNGGYYCFEQQTLFDNFYRAIRKNIVSKKKDYSEEWNDRQKEVSETFPVEVLETILPGATIYKNVYYRWYSGGKGKKHWTEADALIVYDDVLLVLEVKAGAFTYTSPADDFPAYMNSIKSLALAPIEQGRRFLNYIDSADSVELFNEDHKKIGSLSKGEFRQKYICAITLDSFSEIAAQIQRVNELGLSVNERSAWVVSLGDLMVYADIFGNPLSFLHFLEMRMQAYTNHSLIIEDELDHLGLYLKHNHYAAYCRELGNADDPLTMRGYRDEIDKYYYGRLQGDDPAPPTQDEYPFRLREIVDWLAKQVTVGRVYISQLFLNLGGRERQTLNEYIESALEDSLSEVARPFSAHGVGGFTVFCWREGGAARDSKKIFEHPLIAMLAAGEKERVVVELFYDSKGTLERVDHSTVSEGVIPSDRVQAFKEQAQVLKKRRVSKIQAMGKIGRNDQCPCGSGRKYKKCCGK